jgi:hypothetical protein
MIVKSLVAIVMLVIATHATAQQAPTPSTTGEPERKTPDASSPEERAPAAPSSSSSAASAEQTVDSGPLAPLAWLAGCWRGMVNQREFREHWLPLRSSVMVGAGQSVMRGRMLDYQFLRLEPRPDGVYFSQFSGDRRETSFRLASTTVDNKDTIFTFANTAEGFPARLIYRHASEGWLYQTIEGTMNGSERKVIYPMRRIDCESGEFILQ